MDKEPPTLELYQPRYRIETRLFTVCRDGSGTVTSVKIDTKHNTIKLKRYYTYVWDQIKGWCDFAVVAYDDFIYIIGGFDKSKQVYSKRVLRYDPQEDELLEVASLLTGRSKHAALAHDGKIFVTGGETRRGRTISRGEYYGVKEDKWKEWRSLVQPRSNHICAMLNGTLYVSGGGLGGQTRSNVWFFEGDRCKPLDPDCPIRTPRPVQNHCMEVIGNYIYFIGGVKYDVNRSGDIVRSCIISSTTSFRPTLGFKDYDQLEVGDDVELREIIEDRMEKAKVEDENIFPVKINQKPIIRKSIEGFYEKDEMAKNDKPMVKKKKVKISKGDIRLSDIISPWDYSMGEMPCPVHSCGSYIQGDKIFVIGGASVVDTNDMEDGTLKFQCFDTSTKKWEYIGSLPYEKDGILEKTGNIGCGVVTFKRLISIETESPDSDDGSDLPNRWVLW